MKFITQLLVLSILYSSLINGCTFQSNPEEQGKIEFDQCTNERKQKIIRRLQQRFLNEEETDQLLNDLDFNKIGIACTQQLCSSTNFKAYIISLQKNS